MQHNTQHIHTDKHPKQDFQVERLAFFSDAVFAIAITLLVIEFKVPHVTKETTVMDLWHEVMELKFQFLALIFSFAIIANYWLKHHLLFKHIHNYNKKVLKLNLFALLPIIFFPFTTAFLYETLQLDHLMILPFRIFVVNNMASSFAMYFLYWQVTTNHKQLSYKMLPEDKAEFQVDLLWTCISFTLTFILTFLLRFEYAIFIGVMPLAIIKIVKKFTALKQKTKNAK